MNIIPIQQSAIGDRIVRTVDARTLHANLEVGRDFSTWIKGRIDDYGFVEDEDFMTSEGFPRNGGKPLGGRPTVEYTLSTQMAKELAMLENNEIGRRVRRYFIASEEELQHMKEIEHKAQLKALKSEHDEDLEIAAHKINMPSRYWLKDVIKAQKQADLAEGATNATQRSRLRSRARSFACSDQCCQTCQGTSAGTLRRRLSGWTRRSGTSSVEGLCRRVTDGGDRGANSHHSTGQVANRQLGPNTPTRFDNFWPQSYKSIYDKTK